MSEDRIRGWHFLGADRRLRWGSREAVEIGKTYSVMWPYWHYGRTHYKPTLCYAGMHASERVLDALYYAPESDRLWACEVEVWGRVQRDEDKIVGDHRRVLKMADVTMVLHEFACRCAEHALIRHGNGDARSKEAIAVKRRWMRGEATDRELAAARVAAGAAARVAAGAAARAAAGDAAWDAARVAAGAAARAAARAAAGDAAWDAARAAQNRLLRVMIREVM